MAKIVGYTAVSSRRPYAFEKIMSHYSGASGPYGVLVPSGQSFSGLLDVLGGDAAAQQFVVAAWPMIDQKINDKLLMVGAVAAVGYAGLVYLLLRKG